MPASGRQPDSRRSGATCWRGQFNIRWVVLVEVRPLRWVLEGLRGRTKPTPRASAADVGAWGVSRALPLAVPSAPNSNWKLAVKNGSPHFLAINLGESTAVSRH